MKVLFAGLSPGWRLASMASIGACVGMGAYVALISNAASYLSDDPRACINCHIMTPHYASWQKSSHGRFTTCNDCHVPQDNVVHKYLFKAEDGLRHSAIFTLRAEPEVLVARQASKEVIQANCVRCHQDQIQPTSSPFHSLPERSCISCHREVPHGTVHSLTSAPNAVVPPLSPVTIHPFPTQPLPPSR